MSEYEVTDRGFKHYDPVDTTYGAEVRVFESSAAMEPHIWLTTKQVGDQIDKEIGEVSVHMTIEQAERIRDNITAAIENHYHNG